MTTKFFKPTPEQEHARVLFLMREGLRIDAYAGTGKTTTLEFLANSTSERGLYLAFNRSIAEEAKARFPSQVACRTAHSLAFRGVSRSLAYPEWKLTGSLTTSLLLTSFTMPESVTFHAKLTLTNRSYCAVLLEALRRFLLSDDREPHVKHVHRFGSLEAICDDQFEAFAKQAISHVQAIWNAMQSKSGNIPLGHDGYLKLWALSQPKSQMDYLMVDEAQDINPVLFGVINRMQCPIIYVGDPYQQIYDWRGAINAMNGVSTKHRVLLSQSFRFGDAIASAATTIISRIGAREPLRGSSSIPSHLAAVRPDAIVCRSNVGVVGSVLACLARGVKCHVLGGTRELERLLNDVLLVKQGQVAQSSELLGFSAWKDVMAFAGKMEGDYLRSLVTLVQEYGEGTILRALSRCESEESKAQVICSTAHRAKGREWDYVRVDNDFDSAFYRAASGSSENSRSRFNASLEAETRLLYVAMTRAKVAVRLPRVVMERFGLERTTTEILGKVRTVEQQPPEGSVDSSATIYPGVVSPYHSPKIGESREMIAVRRIFRR